QSIVRRAMDLGGSKEIQLRIFRPLSFEITDQSPEIAERFAPKLAILSGLDLLGPTPVSVSVLPWRHLFSKPEGQRILERTLDDNNLDHVGTVSYEFDAVNEGKLYTSKTWVGVFAGDHSLPGMSVSPFGSPGLSLG